METNRNVIIGGLTLVIGIVVTVGTMSAAEGGGTYVVAYGAIAIGAIQLLIGIAEMAGGTDEPEPAFAGVGGARLISGKIYADDYPASALAAGEEGTVTVDFTIAPSGAIEDIGVAQSSGSAALDNAACDVIATRFRYEPAYDDAGNPVAERKRQTVTWRLPDA